VPDEIIILGREEIAVRLTCDETGGQLLALDVTMPPGGGPPGLHRHAAAEVYRVLEGEFAVYLGDERVVAPAGSVFHIAGGREHTIRNESDAPARGYVTFIGDAAPMERFLRSAAAGEDVMELAQRHGIEVTRALD
jgi:quercetin dioxygenase-like cupin family protein